MAWTDLNFSVGQVLTAAQMNQLQANFTAVAQGQSGAPTIYHASSADHASHASSADYASETFRQDDTITWSNSPQSSPTLLHFASTEQNPRSLILATTAVTFPDDTITKVRHHLSFQAHDTAGVPLVGLHLRQNGTYTRPTSGGGAFYDQKGLSGQNSLQTNPAFYFSSGIIKVDSGDRFDWLWFHNGPNTTLYNKLWRVEIIE